MVMIVKREPDSSVNKEEICSKCGVTLSYVPNDVIEDYTTDYTGGRDDYNYIKCPNCGSKLKVY